MKKLKILIVEDETMVAMDLKTRLVQSGYKALDPAGTGLQAIDMVSEEEPFKPGKEKRIIFSVADTGIGFSGEDYNKIFKPFIQGKGSLKRRYDGTGLGLTIASGFIKLMGGRFWVESSPGSGTTFYFVLPFEIEIPGDHATTYSRLSPVPVYIFLEKEMERRLVRSKLENWGLNCLTPVDLNDLAGKTAIIIIDSKNKMESLKTSLSESRGRLSEKRFIALLRSGEIGTLKQINTKAEEYIVFKPWKESELYKVIRECIHSMSVSDEK
mgnify:CR=1 FL=1